MRLGLQNPRDLMLEAVASVFGFKWRNAQRAYDDAVLGLRTQFPSMDQAQRITQIKLDPKLVSVRREARRTGLITVATYVLILVALFFLSELVRH